MSQPSSHDRQHANVRIPPPLVYLAGILSGLGLNWLVPLPMVFSAPGFMTIAAFGAVFFSLGLWLIVWSAMLFRRHGTPIPPWTATRAIVTTGPYRFTRNPMYLSMALIQLGLALMLNVGWVLILLVPVLAVIQTQVIHREERYLESIFGEAYVAYKRAVHRWI